MLYLRIRNPGVCPIEGFTVFGASLSRDGSQSPKSWIIGQFGSGTKHAVALCLRYIDEAGDHKPFSPIVYAGQHKLEFYLEPKTIKDATGSKTVHMVCVQHGGKDQATGRPTKRKEMTSNSIEYGVQDWTEFSMALREFVSNALDMSFRLYCSTHCDAKVKSMSTLSQELNPIPAWKNVTVNIVDEKQVKGEVDYTNVFIELNPVVKNFYESIGRWFLHFSDIKSIREQVILPKTNRNLPRKDYDIIGRKVNDLPARQSAVVYRKGVRVREFGEDRSSDPKRSLFDYNLNHLRMDEARKVDDYSIKSACANALGAADADTLTRFFTALKECQPTTRHQPRRPQPGEQATYCDGPHQAEDCPHCLVDDIVHAEFDDKYWEFDLEAYEFLNIKNRDQQKPIWQATFDTVFGVNAVACDPLLAGMVQMKGYDPVTVPGNLLEAMTGFGIRTSKSVLTEDDLSARLAVEPWAWVVDAHDELWASLHANQLTNDKAPTIVKGFITDTAAPTAIQAQSRKLDAYYKDGVIYVSQDKFDRSKADAVTPEHIIQHNLRLLLLEQVALHLTGMQTNDMGYWKWFVSATNSLLKGGKTKLPVK